MALLKAHWLVPSLMIGCLVCGIGFSLGHHFFYTSLHARIVQSNSEQEWNIRIGTGMAFLVKMCLTAAAGFAYTQLLWTTLRSRDTTLQGVDSMFGVATNAWEFSSLELWRRGFGLVVIAAALWALPIIAVFTPATLTVQPSKQFNESTNTEWHLPTLNFTSPYTYAQWGGEGMAGYVAPSIAISRLVWSVSSQGSILPIQAPSPNSSYSINLYGPSLSCGPLGGNPEFHDAYDRTFATVFGRNWGMQNSEHTYFSFVPQQAWYNNTFDGSLRWQDRTLAGLNATWNTTWSGARSRLDNTADPEDPEARCRFFVVFPSYGSVAKRTTECGLYNSSYHMELTFENGEQAVKIHNKTRLNPVSIAGTGRFDNYSVPDVAYVSIMDSLGRILQGGIAASRYGSLSPTGTQILSTVLTQAREMRNIDRGFGEGKTSQGLGPVAASQNLTMAETIEILATNITLSLFSNRYFLSGPENSTKGNLTSWNSQNEYSYNPRNLYAAYGAGILATLAVVIVGLVCIAASSKSYRSSFSTILRTTRNEELDVLVSRGETGGAEPLSKQLGETKLRLRFHTTAEGDDSPQDSGSVAFMVVSGEKTAVYKQANQAQQDASSDRLSYQARHNFI